MDQIPTYLFIPSALNLKSLFINSDHQIRRFKYELFINVLSSTKPPVLILLTDCKCSTKRTVWKKYKLHKKSIKASPQSLPEEQHCTQYFQKIV